MTSPARFAGLLILFPCLGAEVPLNAQQTGGTAEKGSSKSYFELSLEELSEIKVVSVSRTDVDVRNVSSNVSVLTASDLRRRGARNLFDALRAFPGVDIDYNNRGLPVIVVRGTREATVAKNLLVLLDGHPLNGVFSNGATGLAHAHIPLENIQRIEMVRGPGSAIWGANAVVGVINIITRSAEEIGGTDVAFATEFEAGGNIGQTYSLSWGQLFKGGAEMTLNVSAQDSDGPRQFVRADSRGRSGFAATGQNTVNVQSSLKIGRFVQLGALEGWHSMPPAYRRTGKGSFSAASQVSGNRH